MSSVSNRKPRFAKVRPEDLISKKKKDEAVIVQRISNMPQFHCPHRRVNDDMIKRVADLVRRQASLNSSFDAPMFGSDLGSQLSSQSAISCYLSLTGSANSMLSDNISVSDSMSNLSKKDERHREFLVHAHYGMGSRHLSRMKSLLEENIKDRGSPTSETKGTVISDIRSSKNDNDEDHIVEGRPMDADIDVNWQDPMTQNTALICAAIKDNTEAARLLIMQPGIDVNMKNAGGNTALILACKNGNLDLVRILYEKADADVNARGPCGRTALMRAAESGHFDIVKYLVEYCSADVHIENNKGQTALHCARIWRRSDVVAFLESLIEKQKKRAEEIAEAKRWNCDR